MLKVIRGWFCGLRMSSVMVRVFLILYMAFGVVIEELCPSPLLFLCVVPFGMYLDDDADIVLLMELASCFCLSEFNGFVINGCLSV